MRWDRNGVLLANVAPANVSRIDPNAKSGNNAHDIRSGKFAPKAGGKKRTPAPANVDPREFARMRDAVREAARAFRGDLTPENLQTFINQRAANPNAVNIQQFALLVQQQQLDDLVDMLDGKSRGGIKISAPRGYVKKVLAGLSEDDIAEIVARLEARGISNGHIRISKELPKDRREIVKEKHAALEASDKFDWLPPEPGDEPDDEENEHDFDDLEALVATVARNLPAPVIEVKPNITIPTPPEPKPTKKIIHRDENNMIVAVEEVPDDAS